MIIIQFSRLRLADDLPRLVEALQGKQVVGEIRHRDRRHPAQGAGLASSSPRLSHTAPVRRTRCPNCCTLRIPADSSQSPPDTSGPLYPVPRLHSIVVGGDHQPFPLAGMFPQLECLGEVLAGPPQLAETVVVVAHCPVAHGKIRIKLDGTLIVRQGCGGPFS